ncbi:hypothetical protein BO82DRAFT_362315 [Aspergillus uvarum CBS 121591]|uniref:Amidohydrolase-related domain-containing protein n=1 Tax=Aspergillus uvarum CBS 121591 TaxID=1448315 RepID=A0A319E0B0_9EURO|nr:hypothetical protein BO82DRAFT_362315 [Aspergillus uvarum CBS 121591]PYH84552.1 hypothetical protein BO82DRAFT_362315 [Aspergillus uvarum CBS 121591]
MDARGINLSTVSVTAPGVAFLRHDAPAAGLPSMEFMGGLSVAESVAQRAGYYFETASATSAVQLAALKSFLGTGRILAGTDYPSVPSNQIAATLPTIQTNGGFNTSEMGGIHAENALRLFPRVATVLGVF